MKKSALSLIFTSLLLSSPLLSKERIVVYDNYGYIFSHKKETVGNKFLLEIPNSVNDSSLNIDFIYNNQNIPIVNKTIQNNTIRTLYYQNIGKNIKFKIMDNVIEGKLLSISNNFIKVVTNNESYYYNINSLTGVQFENDFDFSNKVYDISLSNNSEKEVDVIYSAMFKQISWTPTYRFLINEDNNIGYFDYDITVKNNSSYNFKNVGLELLSGSINQPNQRGYNKSHMMAESLAMDSFSSSNNFENFSGYQKLTFENEVDLSAFSSTTYPYLDNKELEYKKNFIFKDYAGANFENRNPEIEIHIERESKKEHFPLMSGQISVFNGGNTFDSTFIGGSHIGTKSSSEDIKFKIGSGQNITISKKVFSDKRRYYDPQILNNKNRFVNIHNVSLSITNDEKYSIELYYKLNKNDIIIEKSVIQSGMSIEDIISQFKGKNERIFKINKETTSKLEFIIIEV